MKVLFLRFAICFATFAYLSAIPNRFRGFTLRKEPRQDPKFPEQYFSQKLDHFDATDLRIWRQRYFINKEFYKPGGPAFLMIGGEGPANPQWMSQGQWITWAKTFNALAIQLEHRYYGKSYPLEDMSEMRYLRSEQALADLANFIENMTCCGNLGLTSSTKWITFGGSYPGALSAWARLKFPHLIDGAVASSAPVHALLDFTGYLKVVAESFASVSQPCIQAIGQAVSEIQSLLLQNPSSLKTELNLCGPVDGKNSLDVATMYSNLLGYLMNVVQYNGDNRAFEGAVATNVTISVVCNSFMLNKLYGSPMQRLAKFIDMMNHLYEEACVEVSYKDDVAELRQVSWANNSQARQWVWQTCTEFAYFQTTDDPRLPFGRAIPLSYYVQQCVDVFGKQFDEAAIGRAVFQTNVNYGSLDYAGTRVILPNGSVDPWHVLGLLKSNSSSVKPVFINGTAHCADMYPSAGTDSKQLVEARQVILMELTSMLTS